MSAQTSAFLQDLASCAGCSDNQWAIVVSPPPPHASKARRSPLAANNPTKPSQQKVVAPEAGKWSDSKRAEAVPYIFAAAGGGGRPVAGVGESCGQKAPVEVDRSGSKNQSEKKETGFRRKNGVARIKEQPLFGGVQDISRLVIADPSYTVNQTGQGLMETQQVDYRRAGEEGSVQGRPGVLRQKESRVHQKEMMKHLAPTRTSHCPAAQLPLPPPLMGAIARSSATGAATTASHQANAAQGTTAIAPLPTTAITMASAAEFLLARVEEDRPSPMGFSSVSRVSFENEGQQGKVETSRVVDSAPEPTSKKGPQSNRSELGEATRKKEDFFRGGQPQLDHRGWEERAWFEEELSHGVVALEDGRDPRDGHRPDESSCSVFFGQQSGALLVGSQQRHDNTSVDPSLRKDEDFELDTRTIPEPTPTPVPTPAQRISRRSSRTNSPSSPRACFRNPGAGTHGIPRWTRAERPSSDTTVVAALAATGIGGGPASMMAISGSCVESRSQQPQQTSFPAICTHSTTAADIVNDGSRPPAGIATAAEKQQRHTPNHYGDIAVVKRDDANPEVFEVAVSRGESNNSRANADGNVDTENSSGGTNGDHRRCGSSEETRRLLHEALRVKRLLEKMDRIDASSAADGENDGLGDEDPECFLATLGLIELKPLAARLSEALDRAPESLLGGPSVAGPEPRTTRALRNQVHGFVKRKEKEQPRHKKKEKEKNPL